MNLPRCTDIDYIQWLIAAQRVFTCTEAQRCNPEGSTVPAHDAYTRLLGRYPPDSEGLWKEVIGCVRREEGSLWIDDSTLDKPYARKMELVSRHWSGKHGRVVQGINPDHLAMEVTVIRTSPVIIDSTIRTRMA